MRLKILILPCLFILVHIGYISCCKCAKAGDGQFVKPRFIRVELANAVTGLSIPAGSITTADSIMIEPWFGFDCTAKNQNPFSYFVSTAQAFKCDCLGCGQNGLKSKLLKIEITSDSAYNGIAAGQDLSSLFRVRKYTSSSNATIPVDSAVKEMNLPGTPSLSVYQFFISTKPTGAKGHAFTMNYYFADNSKQSSASPRFNWY